MVRSGPLNFSNQQLIVVPDGLLSMFKTRNEPKCCGKGIPFKIIQEYGDLDRGFLDHFVAWLKEIHSPNPLYCPGENCLAFIPRFLIQADYATCPFCKNRLCLSCGKKDHAGLCRNDKKLKALITQNKWKFCPSCSQLVERTYGCNHMTCVCGTIFCYRCGKGGTDGRWDCTCGVFAALN